MSVLYLVRHGQASFGAADYDRLSPRGFEQARVVGEALRLRAPLVHQVFTGRLRRHLETATACLTALGEADASQPPPPPLALAGFDEFDGKEVLLRYEPRFAREGEFEAELAKAEHPGRAFEDLFGRAVARWVGGEHDADYTLSWAAFTGRAVAALEEAARGLAPEQTAFVFTSGGPIAAVCQHLLGLPTPQAVKLTWTLVNCGVTKVVHGRQGLSLSTVNEHGHFEGARQHLLSYR
jgi:broad specificity phosphatase PhoE